jgi:hypothetical protein
VSKCGDLALVHDDGADGNVSVLERALCLAQRQPHEVLIQCDVCVGHPRS